MATQGEAAAPFDPRRYGASPGYASGLFFWGSLSGRRQPSGMNYRLRTRVKTSQLFTSDGRSGREMSGGMWP